MTERYRVRVRQGDLEVEVESTDRAYVDAKVDEYLSRDRPTAPQKKSRPSAPGEKRAESLADLFELVNPAAKQEQAAVVAYFMEHFEEPRLTQWRPKDVEERWEQLRTAKPGDTAGTIRQSALFIRGRKGMYRLSSKGVKWVSEALAANEN